MTATYIQHLTMTCDHPAHSTHNRAWSYLAKDAHQCELAAEADGWRWHFIDTPDGPAERVHCRLCARLGQ